jgi:hypothetical protein
LTQRLLLLLGSCAVLWILTAGPVFFLLGPQHLLYAGAAAGLCFVPAAGTMILCTLVLGKSPEQQLAAVMGGMAIRMGFVVGVGMVIFYGVPGFRSASFWLWTIGFYLATLAAEVALIVRRQAPPDSRQQQGTR